MDLLKKLKNIPNDKRHLNLYHHYPKKYFRITEISSEIVSFYEKDKNLKYQSIFFKYDSENIFTKDKVKPLTINDIIEILENTINENVTDHRFFYIGMSDLVYQCSDTISYNTDEEGENECCYVIHN
jgi:hypothetical protein